MWPDEPQSQHVRNLSYLPSGLSFSGRRQKLQSSASEGGVVGLLSDSILSICEGVNGGLKPSRLNINTRVRSLGETVFSKDEDVAVATAHTVVAFVSSVAGFFIRFVLDNFF